MVYSNVKYCIAIVVVKVATARAINGKTAQFSFGTVGNVSIDKHDSERLKVCVLKALIPTEIVHLCSFIKMVDLMFLFYCKKSKMAITLAVFGVF